MQKNPVVITASVAALIAVAAAAVLIVLTSLAGQKSGLDKSAARPHCPKLSAKALRGVTDPGYGTRLERLARCSR
jgi:hypothetical protein